jgi:hypothetical protein
VVNLWRPGRPPAAGGGRDREIERMVSLSKRYGLV